MNKTQERIGKLKVERNMRRAFNTRFWHRASPTYWWVFPLDERFPFGIAYICKCIERGAIQDSECGNNWKEEDGKAPRKWISRSNNRTSIMWEGYIHRGEQMGSCDNCAMEVRSVRLCQRSRGGGAVGEEAVIPINPCLAVFKQANTIVCFWKWVVSKVRVRIERRFDLNLFFSPSEFTNSHVVILH